MTANKKILIKDILSKSDRQFIIPIYQRNYIWPEEQCGHLLDDIKECIETKKEHFFGSIVYQKEQTDTVGDRLYLVDGQQRISTIMLIAKALNLIANSELSNDKDAEWVKNKTNEIIYVDRDDKTKGYKLVPSYQDNDVFNAIIKADSIDEIKKNNSFKNNQIFKNFRLIYGYLLNLIKDKNKNIKEEIFINGLSKLSIVEVGLGIEEDAQEIFQSINNTGCPLTASDCIRNYLLMNLNQEDLNDLYENKWKSIQDDLIGEKNMVDFIMDYLIAKKSDVINKSDLYSEYTSFAKEHKLSNNQINRIWLINDLYECAQIYSAFLKPSDQYNKCINDLMKEIRDLGNTTVFPFLLRVFLTNKNNPNDLKEPDLENILNLIVIYIVRRIVCNVKSGGLRGFMAGLYNRIFAEGNKDDSYYDAICKFLNTLKSDHKIPKLDMFKNDLLKFKLYREKGSNEFCKYLLWKIENGRWPNKHSETVDSVHLTIEHIIPQTRSESYMDPSLDKVYEEYLNTIGNLSLSSREKNAEMSNASFFVKRDILCSDDSKFKVLNRMLINLDKFGEEQLINRAHDLIDKVSKEYRIDEIDSQCDDATCSNDSSSESKIENAKNDSNESSSTSFNNVSQNSASLKEIPLNGDKVDVTNFTPISIIIGGEKHDVKSWSAALQFICEYCSRIDQNELLKYFSYDGSQIKTYQNEKYPWAIIKNTEYCVNVHGSANELFNKITGLSSQFNLDAYINIIKK